MAEPLPYEPSVNPLANPEDLSGPFLAQNEQARVEDSLKWLRSVTTGASAQPPAGGAEPAPTVTADSAQPPAPPTTPPGARTAAPQPGQDGGGGDFLSRASDALTAFMKDVGRGVIESPTQAAGGVSDAIKEYSTTGQHLAEWLNGIIDLKVPVAPGAIPTMKRVLPGMAALSDDAVAQLLSDPFQYLKDRLPDIDKNKSVTGGLIRSVAQFITGLAIGQKMAGAAGVTGEFANFLTGGAIADFAGRDPDSGRLADLLDKVPMLQGPVTDFMKSDPNDPEIVKRLKNAAEGAGLGVLSEGLVRGLRFLRAKTVAQAGPDAAASLADDAMRAARLQHGDIPPASVALGDPARPLVTVHDLGVPADVAARGIAGGAQVGAVGGKGVFVNFARINTPDDVKSVIDQVATAFTPEIKAAQRGVQTNELTRQLADDLGMTVEQILSRRAGQPFNAEQALAARQVMNTTAQQLVDLARTAALPGASQAELFRFQRMLAIHTAVQTEVLAARTETARALQAWAIPAGTGNIEMARNVKAAIDGFGGERGVRDVARRLAGLTDAGASPAAVNTLVRASILSRTGDAIREAWINGLLSGPMTHVVNTTSNAMTLMGAVLDRRLAEAIAAVRGGAGGVVPGEAMAMMHGYIEASGDAMRLAWQALRTGQGGGWRGTLEDAVRPRAISADALGLADDALGRSVDFLGKAVNVPGRLMMSSDEFFKALAYRAELHAQTLRTAMAEGLTGEALASRVKQLLLQPPEHIRMAAVDTALYSTFAQQGGEFAQALMRFRGSVPLGAGPILMPFVRTPANVVRYGFEHSPLAPVVGQWRADLQAGGARADLALARLAMGTTVFLTALDMADKGYITGNGVHSSDEGAKREALVRQGWQPYSIKVGGKYYSYQRLDPVGQTIGMAADISELLRRSDIDPDKMDSVNEILAAGTAATANMIIKKNMLSGLSNFFAMMSDSTRNAPRWMGNLQGSTVASLFNATRQVVDPQEREIMKITDYVTNRLPGLSDTLPPKRDLWGAPIYVDKSGIGPAYSALSPMRTSAVKDSPIDAEMQRLNVGIDRIKHKLDWDGVPVDMSDWPKVYDAYVRLAGNDLKHPAWGVGAKDFLDAVVTGKHPMSEVYNLGTDGPDGTKAAFIQRTISGYRELARSEIMNDPQFQDFADVVRQGRDELQRKRMPAAVR